jgi:hypothetical protein
MPTAPMSAIKKFERLKRTFDVDITLCPLCGGSLRVVADITDPEVIDKILAHISNTRAPPARTPKRSSQHILPTVSPRAS